MKLVVEFKDGGWFFTVFTGTERREFIEEFACGDLDEAEAAAAEILSEMSQDVLEDDEDDLFQGSDE